MYAAGQSVTISGAVTGDVIAAAQTVIITGSVDGSVERVAPPQQAAAPEASPGAAFVGWLLGLLYALVALSLVTLMAGLLLPRLLRRVTDHLVPSPWKALLVGFVAAIAVPPVLLLLLVTIVGAPLALAGMLVWSVLTLATLVFGAHCIGRLVLRGAQHPVVTTLVGGLILIVGRQIPWLNILVWTAMVCLGLGARLLEPQRQRPWRASSRTAAGTQPPLPAEAHSVPTAAVDARVPSPAGEALGVDQPVPLAEDPRRARTLPSPGDL